MFDFVQIFVISNGTETKYYSNTTRYAKEKQAEEEENERKKSKFLGLIPGIGSVITFLLTEDMRNPMVLVDRWTILMIAILVIGAAMAYLTRNKDEEEEEEKPEEA